MFTNSSFLRYLHSCFESILAANILTSSSELFLISIKILLSISSLINFSGFLLFKIVSIPLTCSFQSFDTIQLFINSTSVLLNSK
ncbi:hypothetical protein A0H76_1093 [Hepatospora eriocheir]|uniref:Uncharacterized protein n=1 Tax=Hepatospora eriocheir TaxID=1081669 RepID=A0A1X0Q655_9MICR|nr:hypothetical protein A0H76_1093 [Hepatospora eriocheir]